MNLAQAIDVAHELALPGLMMDEEATDETRLKNEEAISLLVSAWFEAPAGQEPFSFDLVRNLADQNRVICDAFGEERLRTMPGVSLARSLSDEETVRGLAKLQKRRESAVLKTAGEDLSDLSLAYIEKPVRGMVVGFDIETTSRFPDRGYIINMGIAFMELSPDAVPQGGHAAYFGLPQMYMEKGVPLAEIHGIEPATLAGKKSFREDERAQAAILKALMSAPAMAHNAAFEDSWLLLNLNGYAEARKAGKIIWIDSREICRRIDPEVRNLPRDSNPAALENWARRRGTLREGESERHLGLDDVFLMLQTVQAEFIERNIFAS